MAFSCSSKWHSHVPSGISCFSCVQLCSCAHQQDNMTKASGSNQNESFTLCCEMAISKQCLFLCFSTINSLHLVCVLYWQINGKLCADANVQTLGIFYISHSKTHYFCSCTILILLQNPGRNWAWLLWTTKILGCITLYESIHLSPNVYVTKTIEKGSFNEEWIDITEYESYEAGNRRNWGPVGIFSFLDKQ